MPLAFCHLSGVGDTEPPRVESHLLSPAIWKIQPQHPWKAQGGPSLSPSSIFLIPGKERGQGPHWFYQVNSASQLLAGIGAHWGICLLESCRPLNNMGVNCMALLISDFFSVVNTTLRDLWSHGDGGLTHKFIVNFQLCGGWVLWTTTLFESQYILKYKDLEMLKLWEMFFKNKN